MRLAPPMKLPGESSGSETMLGAGPAYPQYLGRDGTEPGGPLESAPSVWPPAATGQHVSQYVQMGIRCG